MADELVLRVGQRALPRREVGRCNADPLGFVLARPLRGLGLSLELDHCQLSPFDVRLRVGDAPLTGLDRAERLGRGLLLLIDVRLQARERSLDLGELGLALCERGLAPCERRLALGDPILGSLDGCGDAPLVRPVPSAGVVTGTRMGVAFMAAGAILIILGSLDVCGALLEIMLERVERCRLVLRIRRFLLRGRPAGGRALPAQLPLALLELRLHGAQ